MQTQSRLIVPFLVLLLVLPIILVVDAKRAAADPLRVMSFNIRYGTADDGPNRWERRRDLLIDVLREEAPDVIGVQEALHFQLEAIVTALPDYGFVGVGRDDGKRAGEYAAILYRKSRLRPTESRTFWFSDTPDVPGSTSWGNQITRICTWARFEDADGRPFYVYNVHLDHQSQPSRERSAAMLRDRIAAREPRDPVVVTGDFNAGEDNPAVKLLVGGAADDPSAEGARLVDTFRVKHPDEKEVGTYTAFRVGTTGGAKIDYVLVEPTTRVLSAAIVRTSRDGRYPSDHFPVTATVEFPIAEGSRP